MGTFASISAPARDRAKLHAALGAATGVVAEVVRDLNLYDPGSELSRLNAAAGGQARRVSHHTLAVLAAGREVFAISGGCFDPTVGPLAALWGFGKGPVPGDLPDPARIAEVRALVGLDKVEVNGASVRLPVRGMTLDFGGIAKGYGVDMCYDSLRTAGLRDVMVNIGGNLRVGGRPSPERRWCIGVRNPFDRGRILGTLELEDGEAVATSGNYERFVKIGERTVAHIIDPRTGRPVEGMAGVTVVCPTAVEADGLSTALFVLGIERAASALGRRPGRGALLVPDRRPIEVYVSPAFRRRFSPAPGLEDAVRPLPAGAE
jgi:thiamine biosynthesis lipoprotein